MMKKRICIDSPAVLKIDLYMCVAIYTFIERSDVVLRSQIPHLQGQIESFMSQRPSLKVDLYIL